MAARIIFLSSKSFDSSSCERGDGNMRGRSMQICPIGTFYATNLHTHNAEL